MDKLAQKLEDLPIEKVAAKLVSILETLDNLLKIPEIKEMVSNINGAGKKLNQVLEDTDRLVLDASSQLKELTGNLNNKVTALSDDMQRTLADTRVVLTGASKNLNGVSSDARKVLQGIDVQITPVMKEIHAVLLSAKTAMDGAANTLLNVDGLVGERSDTRNKVNRALDEISAAARSLESLMDLSGATSGIAVERQRRCKMRSVKKFLNAGAGWLLLCFLASILAGCTGASGPSTFYLLHSMEEASLAGGSTAAGEKSVSVLVGPVTLPGYLDRTQMVSLAGRNQLVMDEFNRWGETLQESFYRVLLENLSFLLKTPRVYGYDRGGSNAADYQVVIDVTRFDSMPGGDAILTAFWTVSRKDGSTPGITRKSVFRAPVSAAGLPGTVEAQNQTLTAFSREIASAIQSLQ